MDLVSTVIEYFDLEESARTESSFAELSAEALAEVKELTDEFTRSWEDISAETVDRLVELLFD